MERKGIAWLAIGLAYVSLGMAARFGGWLHYWDVLGLVEVTRALIKGDLNIYALNYGEPLRLPYTAYPPLMPFLIAPFVALSDAFLGGSQVTLVMAGMPLLIFDVLAARTLVGIIEKNFSVKREHALLLGVFVLMGAGMLHASAFMSHPESVTLFFMLLGMGMLMSGRYAPGGLSLGLAILSKHTAILPIIPLVLMLIKRKLSSGKLQLVSFTLALAIPVVAVLLPFYLTNPSATYDALVGHIARLRLRHESMWKVVDMSFLYLSPAQTYQQVHAFLMETATIFPLLGASLVGILALRFRDHLFFDGKHLGAIALSGYLQLILSKTVAPHYYVVPLGLLILWDAFRSKGFPYFGMATSLWLWTIHNIEWSHPVGVVLFLSNVFVSAYIAKQTFFDRRPE